jgi:hypothetical protein
MSDDGARPVDVRVLAEGNVGALIACLRSCYGDSYTEPEFYDSSYLRAELRGLRPARTPRRSPARAVN